MTSVLVETGVHNLAAVKEFEQFGREDLVPTYYIQSLKALIDMLQK
ncbi:unnamed protein product [Gongylonema pulchrum]|uniref:Succinyl-diaminopimelate desuccinylase n=1 Tax=Gongylonema pulchrum TaxID=637853 RepID=A0A183CZN7_9BILA|nr:unnamed protein product [Gongylonema pulchrum]